MNLNFVIVHFSMIKEGENIYDVKLKIEQGIFLSFEFRYSHFLPKVMNNSITDI